MIVKTSLPPGFRFHPTDVELVWYYLKRKIMGKPFRFEAISELELYKFAPWDLPAKSCLRSKDLAWYFFCPRDKKYSNGSRTNRATEIGFWKTTGRDRSIVHNSQTVGMKKTLIFHLGKVLQGSRTDWVMYEFRLESKELVNAGYTQDAYVLCKIFQKSGSGPKNGEQYGAPFKEEDWEDDADMENANSDHLFCHVPLQSIGPEVAGPLSMSSNFEIGEPSSVRFEVESSSMQYCSEVGGPFSISSNFEIGEPSSRHFEVELSSMPDCSEVGEPTYMPELPYEGGILLKQLEALLNSSPPRSEYANGEMLDSAVLLNSVIQAPHLDYENVYGDLVNLCVQPPLSEPTDGIALSDTIDYEYELHPALAEFAEEHYMELSDIGFADEGNPVEFVAPHDYRYPFANDPSYHGISDIYIDSVVDTYLANEPQLTGLNAAEDQVQSTSEYHQTRKGGNS